MIRLLIAGFIDIYVRLRLRYYGGVGLLHEPRQSGPVFAYTILKKTFQLHINSNLQNPERTMSRIGRLTKQ
jgi:hypothetical protein